MKRSAVFFLVLLVVAGGLSYGVVRTFFGSDDHVIKADPAYETGKQNKGTGILGQDIEASRVVAAKPKHNPVRLEKKSTDLRPKSEVPQLAVRAEVEEGQERSAEEQRNEELEAEAMEYEALAMDLEAEASDVRHQVEELQLAAQAEVEEEQGEEAEEEPEAVSEEVSPEIQELMEKAEELEKKSLELHQRAEKIRESGGRR